MRPPHFGHFGQQQDELARLVSTRWAPPRKQVDYHLTRAQAAATTRMPGARTPLRSSLEGCCAPCAGFTPNGSSNCFCCQSPESLAFRGDEQDLQEMLGNLLDNACKWAAGHVDVAQASKAASCRITIDDDGRARNRATECCHPAAVFAPMSRCRDRASDWPLSTIWRACMAAS
jgi:hypothetical protein